MMYERENERTIKTKKAIAALCAATMALSTMALPVQAKTSKTETEVITMDDTAKPSKSKKATKAATDEYKDFGKDLKVTAHKPEDITKAYLYAHMMCASSLTVTLAKDYKMFRSCAAYEIDDQVCLTCSGWIGKNVLHSDTEWGANGESAVYKNFGDILSYFNYVYRTGDTDKIPKNYDKLYERLADGVDSCTADTDSITDVADNICVWLKDNTAYSETATFSGVLGKSSIRLTSDGKMFLKCEGYSYMFMTMMRMAGYTAHYVSGLAPNKGEESSYDRAHAWNAVKVGNAYRYYEPQSTTIGAMTYKEMIKAGYEPKAWYRDPDYGTVDFKSNPTQKEVEAQFIHWH